MRSSRGRAAGGGGIDKCIAESLPLGTRSLIFLMLEYRGISVDELEFLRFVME